MLICTMTLCNCLHPWAVIEVCSDVWTGATSVEVWGVNTLAAVMVDMLSDVLVEESVERLASVDVTMLADAVKFIVSVSLDMALLSCCVSCSCCPTTVSDCDRALQTWKPSDHS